jgi:hypothetical protein
MPQKSGQLRSSCLYRMKRMASQLPQIPGFFLSGLSRTEQPKNLAK